MADPLKVSPLSLYGDSDRAYQADVDARNAAVSPLEAFSPGWDREYYLSDRIGTVLQPTVDWMTDSDSFPRQPPEPEIEYLTDPDYDYVEDVLNINYEPSHLSKAVSAEHAAQIRTEIDEERESLRLIGANNWGTLGSVMGSVFNPHVAVGLAVAPTSIFAAVALETTLEAGSEAYNHSQQRLRTLEESYWAVGLTGAGIAIVGGMGRVITNRALPVHNTEMDRVLNDTFDTSAKPGTGDQASAGAQQVRPDPMTLTREDDALVGGWLANKLSIGQVAAVIQSPFKVSRDIISRLADNPLYTKGMQEGKTRGVSVEGLSEAAMGPVVRATETAEAMQKVSGLKPKVFGTEVRKAMTEGDVHVNAKVQEAAEMYRKEVIDPIKRFAERLGLLESDEALSAKILSLDEDIQKMVDEGAGPGSVQVLRDLDVERAKIVTTQNKKTVELQKAVTKLTKQLETARKPLKGKTEARVAKPDMIKRHNEAKTKLTAHKKAAEALTKENRAKASALKKQKQYLAKVRKERKVAQAKLDDGLLGALSYFPRIYNSQKIYKHWASLENKLTIKFREKMAGKFEEAEIMEAVRDTMLNMVAGRGVAVGGGKVPSAMRARVLDLMDDQLEEFVEVDAATVMLKHAQGMQPYLIMRDTFGDDTLADLFVKIDDEHAAMLSKGKVASVQPSADPYAALPDNVPYTAKEMQKLADQVADDKVRIKVVYDRIMHQVQRSIGPTAMAEKVLQASKIWNVATMLGHIVFVSLPDLARIVSHYGLRGFGMSTAHGMKQLFGGKTGLASRQVKQVGVAINRTLNQRAMDLSDSLEPQTKAALVAQKLWSKVTGFDAYTDIVQSMAAHAAMDWTLGIAEKVTKGVKLSTSETAQVTRMGLTADDLRGAWKESEGTMGAQDTVLKYMNTMQWKDVDLARRVEAAIGSDVHRTIIKIGAGEKPARMDGHLWSWFLQFQSFAMSAQNKIMVAGIQNANLKQANGLAAMMFLGASVGAGTAWLRGEDVSKWSAEQWVFEGIDRSGMAGALRTPFNMLRYVGAMTGVTDGVPSRYIGREWGSMITPPGVSIVNHANKAAVAMFEGDHEKAANEAVKATPFLNNTWKLRQLLQQMGDS